MQAVGSHRVLKPLVAVLTFVLLLVPATGASQDLVLWDPLGDVSWTVGGAFAGPRPLQPVRDLAAGRNESGVDVNMVRVGENRTHVFVELGLEDLPPEPAACSMVDGSPTVASRCRYSYVVRWTYYDADASWGPEVRVSWTVECRPACSDEATVRVGDGPDVKDSDDVLTFERLPPNVARWTMHKAVFRNPQTTSAGGEAGSLCSGDLFLVFSAEVRATQAHGAFHYRDFGWPDAELDGEEVVSLYTFQDDGPGCDGTVGGGPVEGTVESGRPTAPGPVDPSAWMVLSLLFAGAPVAAWTLRNED